ncbi:MAG: tetratricopeptide repeat protein [Candidatus Poribacteria bacterium]|nr:tetratricopeptide repeat protein [Candidatus Poribacteria bacterium]
MTAPYFTYQILYHFLCIKSSENPLFTRFIALFLQLFASPKRLIPLKKAIEMGLRSKEAYINLGVAYVQRGKFAEAITAAKKALEIDPKYKRAQELIDSIAMDEN